MINAPTLDRFLQYRWWHCLDVGAGSGEATKRMRAEGRHVTTLDWRHDADVVGDYMSAEFLTRFDAIWCSHVLEHQVNPGAFLQKLRRDLTAGGVLAITVPPLKQEIVGGHVSLWNEGLLLYHLVLAGFDCSAARVGVYGYNISVIVERRDAKLPPLRHGDGDLEALAPFFPVPVAQGFDGRIGSLRW